MPRPSRSHDRFTEDRDEDRPRARPRRNLDADVIALRETGLSYGAVASSLGLKRATDAHAAFVRAAKALPDSERSSLIDREAGRLDRLEARIRSRDEGQPAKMARRLEALEVLRRSLA